MNDLISSNTTDPVATPRPTGKVLLGQPMTLDALNAKATPTSLVDETTGASLLARLAVASLAENDHLGRLQALRRFYPGAMLDENGDYLYLNPKTGGWTKMNESQFTFKDVLASLPAMGEVGGGILGGMAGAASGLPTFGLGSFPGAVAGAGAGAVAGRQGVTRAMQALTGAKDTRPIDEQGREAAAVFGANALGEGGARVVGAGLVKGGRGILDWAHITPSPEEAAITEAAGRLGVAMPKALNTRSKVLNYLTARLRVNPVTTQTMASAGEDFLDQSAQALGKQEARLAGPNVSGITPFNNRLKEASKGWIDRYKATLGAMNDQMEGLLPTATRVPVPNSLSHLADLEAKIAESPELNWTLYGKAIEKLRSIASDAAGATRSVAAEGLPGAIDAAGNPIMSGVRQEVTRAPGVPFSVLRKIRTEIGDEAFWESPLTRKTAEEVELGGVYDALKKDLGLAAEKAGPEAADLWKLQNRYIQMSRSDKRLANYDLFQKIAENGGKDVSPAAWAASMETQGPEKMRSILARFTPDERQALVGSIFEDMGSVERNGVRVWDMERFAQQWDKLANVRQGLFDSPTFRQVVGPLQDLLQISSVAKTAKKAAEWKPGNITASLGALTKYMAIPVAGAMTAHPVIAALGAVTPIAAASLMTNPTAVTILRNAARAGTWSAANGTRLLLLKKSEPYLADSIDEFLGAGAQTGFASPAADPTIKHNTGRPSVQYEPIP